MVSSPSVTLIDALFAIVVLICSPLARTKYHFPRLPFLFAVPQQQSNQHQISFGAGIRLQEFSNCFACPMLRFAIKIIIQVDGKFDSVFA